MALTMLTLGQSDEEIAVYLSLKPAEFHSLFQRLCKTRGVNSREELVRVTLLEMLQMQQRKLEEKQQMIDRLRARLGYTGSYE